MHGDGYSVRLWAESCYACLDSGLWSIPELLVVALQLKGKLGGVATRKKRPASTDGSRALWKRFAGREYTAGDAPHRSNQFHISVKKEYLLAVGVSR